MYKETVQDDFINEETKRLIETLSKWMQDTLSAFMAMFSIQPSQGYKIAKPNIKEPYNPLLNDFLRCFSEINRQNEKNITDGNIDKPDICLGMDLLYEDLAKMQEALDDIRNSLNELYTLDACIEYLQMAFLSVMQNYIFRQITDIATKKLEEIKPQQITGFQKPSKIILH